jgi:hypothetical protein
VVNNCRCSCCNDWERQVEALQHENAMLADQLRRECGRVKDGLRYIYELESRVATLRQEIQA